MGDERQFNDLHDSRPLLLVLHEQPANQVLHSLRAVLYRIRLFLHYLEHETEQILSMESVLQSVELVEDTAQCPDVALISVGLVLAHLGRHVVRSALNRHSVVLSAFKNFTDAKVAQFHVVVIG